MEYSASKIFFNHLNHITYVPMWLILLFLAHSKIEGSALGIQLSFLGWKNKSALNYLFYLCRNPWE